MKITVIIPTYRRPQNLACCLEGLKKQVKPPDEVIIIARETDRQTWEFLKTFNPETLCLNPLTVTVPGVIAALNLGLDAAQGEIIAITDDDAVPRPEWLERLETHFLSDSQVGGVGGRDWMYIGTELQDASMHPGASNIVGRVQWFGRVIGNHHIGRGEAREVDVLKGVNMGFRRQAIGDKHFDTRLRGAGAQVHYEIEFCLGLKRAGWKLIYDPLVDVDHYHGQRFDRDQRNNFEKTAMINHVHNETLVLLEYLSPVQRLFFLSWALLIGVRSRRGLIQCLRFLPSEGVLSVQKLIAAFQGRWQGVQTWKQTVQSNSSPVT